MILIDVTKLFFFEFSNLCVCAQMKLIYSCVYRKITHYTSDVMTYEST
jgi:hypothetical protein